MTTPTHEVAREIADGCYRAPMRALIEYIGNPFEEVPWDCDQFSMQDVLNLPDGQECDAPYRDEVVDYVVGQSSYHIARIAYLLKHGWDESGADHHTPVLEVGINFASAWPLLDGNHRFAAAIARGDEFFTVYVDGDLDAAEQMFGMEQSAVA